MSNISDELRDYIRLYRMKSNMAYSDVEDKVHTQEEYEAGLIELEDAVISEILNLIERERVDERDSISILLQEEAERYEQGMFDELLAQLKKGKESQ